MAVPRSVTDAPGSSRRVALRRRANTRGRDRAPGMAPMSRPAGAMVGRIRAPFRDGGTRCELAPPGLQCACNVALGLTVHSQGAHAVLRPIIPRHAPCFSKACAPRAVMAGSSLPARRCRLRGRASTRPGHARRRPSARRLSVARGPRATNVRRRAADARRLGAQLLAGGAGSLADHGVTEMRFAGSTWDEGTSSGVTMAVFEAAGLPRRLGPRVLPTGAEAPGTPKGSRPRRSR